MISKQAVVLGASGHLGAHIVRSLLSEGHAVRAAYSRPETLRVLQGLAVEPVQVDYAAPDGLRAALQDAEWVFYACGYYPTQRLTQRAVIKQAQSHTQRLLAQISQASPERVVLTSSAVTLRQHLGRPTHEADVYPWPLTQRLPLYTCAKLAVEQVFNRAFHEQGLPVIRVLPTKCIGEYDTKPTSGKLLLQTAKRRGALYLDYHFNMVYSGDVGLAQVYAAAQGRPGESYLLSGETLTLRELASLMRSVRPVEQPRWAVPYGLALAAAYLSEGLAKLTLTHPRLPCEVVSNTRYEKQWDSAKAKQALKWPQTPARVAIERAMRWFEENRYFG